MKIHQDINQALGITRPVVTTGTFDGVHCGHQRILERINELAAQVSGESVLFTFHPHPRTVLYPDDHGLRLLQTREEKHESLRAAGIQHLIEVPFTREFATTGAKDYVNRFLVDAIGVHTMVIGYDHRFGKSREGDINTLRVMGEDAGFAVEEIPAYLVDALKVSSTKIRNALLEGDVSGAAVGLGRPYKIQGEVVGGERIGRDLGFPTANISVQDGLKLIPANGVYAIQAKLGDESFKGMMNIGFRPTLSGDEIRQRTLEAHLFDFDRDIYGREIVLEFIQHIREEQRFADMDSLKEQLLHDKQKALEIL